MLIVVQLDLDVGQLLFLGDRFGEQGGEGQHLRQRLSPHGRGADPEYPGRLCVQLGDAPVAIPGQHPVMNRLQDGAHLADLVVGLLQVKVGLELVADGPGD